MGVVAPELRVAICTSRPAAAAREAVAAAASQVPEGHLVVVTSGLDRGAVAEHAAAFSGTVLVEHRPGLSRARNRALAWAPGDAVLAFVDDDAVVDPGWADELTGAWAAADERVACIGGPIRPRFEVAPPAWLSDPLLPALTLLDLGEEALELDPDVTTVYGANISFRVGPLRDVGGFDPAFGHSGARVYFSEEDEAQRALAGLGYRVRYAPGPGVHARDPGRAAYAPRSFVRRRFAYGTALGARGARAPGVALRQALSSAAGCLPAALARDDKLVMERAVRVAENAGVLAAPLLRR